jgi:hypothetical protein
MLFLGQSRLVHLPGTPSRVLMATPYEAGMDYESVTIPTEDGLALHGWFVPANPSRGTLLFLHGNAGNISHRLDSLQVFNRLGMSTLIFDYRGYGQSEGSPSEQGLYQDSVAALGYLASERGIGPEQTVIFGRSLGGAVAAWLAAHHPSQALIIESTFTSVPDMAAELYPCLPARLLARLRYDTLENIRLVRSPVLVIHSRDDEMIPFHHGETLYQAAHEPKQFLEIQGDHNMGFLLSRERYEEGIGGFLAAYGYTRRDRD